MSMLQIRSFHVAANRAVLESLNNRIGFDYGQLAKLRPNPDKMSLSDSRFQVRYKFEDIFHIVGLLLPNAEVRGTERYDNLLEVLEFDSGAQDPMVKFTERGWLLLKGLQIFPVDPVFPDNVQELEFCHDCCEYRQINASTQERDKDSGALIATQFLDCNHINTKVLDRDPDRLEEAADHAAEMEQERYCGDCYMPVRIESSHNTFDRLACGHDVDHVYQGDYCNPATGEGFSPE